MVILNLKHNDSGGVHRPKIMKKIPKNPIILKYLF